MAVACLQDSLLPQARVLARSLALDCVSPPAGAWRDHQQHALLLLFSDRGLALAATGKPRIDPVCVDFADAALLRRIREVGARRQDLARAVGVPERRGLNVIDATAGWGRDSAVLAALGCEVTMIERNPVVAVLLRDGLQRAQGGADAERLQWPARLGLINGDAISVLAHWHKAKPDVILVDPMFAVPDKSAAVRKEMRFFQQLVGDDEDSPGLLAAALSCAAYRVVVKRPRKAPALAGRPPDHAIDGSSTRFDVYALRSFRTSGASAA